MGVDIGGPGPRGRGFPRVLLGAAVAGSFALFAACAATCHPSTLALAAPRTPPRPRRSHVQGAAGGAGRDPGGPGDVGAGQQEDHADGPLPGGRGRCLRPGAR